MRRPTLLLKWAGGKSQLLPHLRRFYPPAFDRYIEPFFGSGAVFFDLHANGRLEGRDAVLIDSNADLIGCYEAVRDAPEAVGDALDVLAEGHARGARAHYYEVRDERFNPTRQVARKDDGRIEYTPELAAMLIYLNRTGFNGLFRVNASGAFNVPAGHYSKPHVSDRARLGRVSEALRSTGIRLECASFELAGTWAKAGDFVYLDPPYAPLTRTANFTSYTAPGFGAGDQVRVRDLVVSLARRGTHVLLSNSSALEMVSLYGSSTTEEAGLRAVRVPARRAINSDASRRGPVDELLVTNIEGGGAGVNDAPASQTPSRHSEHA